MSVLIVEGDSDQRFYTRFLDPLGCRAFSPTYGGGKEDAIALFSDLKANRLAGVAALVDADCDRFWNRNRPHEDICWTACSDREMMVLYTDAFEGFVAVALPGQNAEGLRTRVVSAAFPLGAIRIVSRRNNWGLSFSNVDFNAFIGLPDIVCDEGSCIREILRLNPQVPVDSDDLVEALRTVRSVNHHPGDVVCGHDVTGILSLVCSGGSSGPRSQTQVEFELDRCFERGHFAQTSTFTELKQWETRNVPFVITT